MSAAEAREPPGLWLRRQRVAAGLTQEDLAERSGVSVRAIADLERGRTRKPYPSSVRALTHALGMPDTASTELVARYRSGGDGAGNGPAAPATDVARATAAAAADGVLSGDVTAAEGIVPGSCRRRSPLRNRASELDLLDRALDDVSTARTASSSPVIGVYRGVGKTALALHWAHRVSGGSRTGSSTPTCGASTRLAIRPNPPTRCAGSSTLQGAPRRVPAGTEALAACTGACSPTGRCSCCSTTPRMSPRCARAAGRRTAS
jgi:transcriptional regulator with XRE-family HTH domain